MAKDTQSRKWQITINNPIPKGYDHIRIKELLSELKSMIYWCMSDEVGENGTYHTHIFVACSSAVRFSTIKNKFPEAHIEMARGTCQQNKEYLFKEGKWRNDKKHGTNIPEKNEEYGEMPVERQGQRNDIHDLYDKIKQGMSNYEIIEDSPEFMFQIDKIERARQVIMEEKYKNTFRKLEVVYIYGETGSGKTRGIMELYGYENVHRITDYEHPFDTYRGQDVMIFEEFRSSLKIADMLNYLDGYPLELPCRYTNKRACYTKVYIITNIPLNQQYQEVQDEYPETWKAFLRRIKKVKIYKEGRVLEYDMEDYIKSTEYVFKPIRDKKIASTIVNAFQKSI